MGLGPAIVNQNHLIPSQISLTGVLLRYHDRDNRNSQMAQLIGRTLDRYEIVDLVGAGGMGAVYRARDTELGREVAIKVLGDNVLGSKAAQDRFAREARTIAGVSHPNILDIHDFGTTDGITYAVMELLEGRNLREWTHHRSVSIHQALEIATSVCEGLGAAHGHGVIHRDIKPENIFITTDGKVKILDFGLARPVRTEHGPDVETATLFSEITEDGTVVGTSGYMSPEQARGLALDCRSDIFSLGCVLYELFGGRHPFRRDTKADTLTAILTEEPEPLSSHCEGLPPAVEFIVHRCLKKDPDNRFESARDVAYALRALSETSTTALPPAQLAEPKPRHVGRWLAIAILAIALVTAVGVQLYKLIPVPLPQPMGVTVTRFESSGDELLEKTAAGLTELVAAGLELVQESSPTLAWVVPPHAAEGRDPARLGEQAKVLSVNVGVTGRLRRDGNKLLLELWAVDPATGRKMGHASIEEDVGNVSALQIEPIIQTAEMLGENLDQATIDRLARFQTNVTDAFGGYLTGTGAAVLADDEIEVVDGLEILEGAIAADPTYLPARIELARACLKAQRLTGNGMWLDRGLAEAQRALSGEQPPVDAYLVMGQLHRRAGDLGAAIDAYSRAAELAPGNPEAHFRLGRSLQSAGRFDDADRELQRVVYLRPGYWPDHHWLAELYQIQGRYDAAANQYRRVIELAPDHDAGYLNLGGVYLAQGRTDDAREAFETALRVLPEDNYIALANLGAIYFEESRFADAAEMFERALAMDDTNSWVWGNLGFAYKNAGDTERAQDPLRRAVELAEDGVAELYPAMTLNYSSVWRAITPPWANTASRPRHPRLGHRHRHDRPADSSPKSPRRSRTLDDREAGADVGGAGLCLGVPPTRFQNRPSLRGLLADPRYQSHCCQALTTAIEIS